MNEELKKKIQKELLDPIKDPRRVMKMEYLFSHKYILIAVIIAVDLFLIMAFSFLFHMVGMIPRIWEEEKFSYLPYEISFLILQKCQYREVWQRC